MKLFASRRSGARCSPRAIAAHAQFVKGNEAVQVMPDGTKKVETPPTAGCHCSRKPCAADQAGMHRRRLEDGRDRRTA